MKPDRKSSATSQPAGGLASWLLSRIHRTAHTQSRLTLLERISLAPRQSLALVEADGQRLLVATSAEGTPLFYPLHETGESERAALLPCRSRDVRSKRRISW